MSVEQQLSKVVQACNNLTEVVNTKISQIDQKVDIALEAVPSKIKAEMDQILYVNAKMGNDDNDGFSPDNAKKTIFNAIESVPIGGISEIRLNLDDEHIIDNFIKVEGKMVFLVGSNPDGLGNYAKVRPNYFISNDEVHTHQISIGKGGFIYARYVSFDTAVFGDNALDKAQISYKMSLFTAASSYGKIILEHCDVNIFNGSFMHQHTAGSFGFSDLFMRRVDVNKRDISGSEVPSGRQYLVDSYIDHAIPFDFYGVEMTLVGAESYAEMVAVNMANTRSNLI